MSKTLSLSTRQWRVLLNDNLDVLKATVQSTEVINDDGLKQFCAQLDDMKMLASAWFQVGMPVGKISDKPIRDIGAEMGMPAISQGNGAAEPKKRRGRRPNAEKAAAAQAVQ